jgi:hypothetical protein
MRFYEDVILTTYGRIGARKYLRSARSFVRPAMAAQPQNVQEDHPRQTKINGQSLNPVRLKMIARFQSDSNRCEEGHKIPVSQSATAPRREMHTRCTDAVLDLLFDRLQSQQSLAAVLLLGSSNISVYCIVRGLICDISRHRATDGYDNRRPDALQLKRDRRYSGGLDQ